MLASLRRRSFARHSLYLIEFSEIASPQALILEHFRQCTCFERQSRHFGSKFNMDQSSEINAINLVSCSLVFYTLPYRPNPRRKCSIPIEAGQLEIDEGTPRPLRIVVGIATAGRPEILRAALVQQSRQTRPADRIIVSAPAAADVGSLGAISVDIVLGRRGLTCQRNEILAKARDCDVVVYFDDDFFPAMSYLAEIERIFARHGDVVMATGVLMADGIIGPGIEVAEAQRLLAANRGTDGCDGIRDVYNAYGCNFAVRVAPVLRNRFVFDENLPLYGWLEDVDFSRQLAPHGRIVRVAGARGIHLGIKRARQSGRRLGYSQIANPIYLSRKGTCAWSMALRLMGRNVAANCLRSLRPEPYIDRRGRIAGNVRAVADLLAGRLDPMRVLNM